MQQPPQPADVLMNDDLEPTTSQSLGIMENGWLLEVIQSSLKASTSTTASTNPPPHSPPQGDSPRQRLIDGIVYSRKFILTYHIFVLASICALSALHWTGEYIRWRRTRASRWQTLVGDEGGDAGQRQDNAIIVPWSRKESEDSIVVASSPGSSTNGSIQTFPSKDFEQDENTPLLPHLQLPRKSWLSVTRAALVYQPPSIPIFNKLNPSNGTSLVILAFLGLNLFYCSYNMEFSLRNVFVLADRWGLMFVANLPLLYLFAAKNQPLKFLTGRSYESLNIFHRRLGELLCFQALLHGLSMTLTWYFLIRPTGRLNFKQYILLPVTTFGLGAFFAYEMLYLTSLGSFRQRFYELFLSLHVFLQCLALLFVYFHHRVGQIYVGAALAIFLTDRLIFRLWAKCRTVDALGKIMEDGETIKLSVPINVQRKGWDQSIVAGWKPTDHVFVTVTALGKDHILTAHPFTIASPAPSQPGHNNLELLIRAQEGFSRALLNYVHRHTKLTLRLDGPYGSSHARSMLEDSDIAVVVAGGSGIAVAWPLIAHLASLSSTTGSENQQRRRSQRIILIWVIHQDTHASWLPASSIESARSQGVEIIMPKPTEEAGRPDLKGLVEEVVRKNEITGRERVGVVASGPDGMNRLVRNTCAGLIWSGRDVHVTIEKFGW